MLKRLPISIVITTILATPTINQAREFGGVEVTTHLKNETSVFVRDGQRTGQASSTLDRTESDAGDLLKFENSARMFFNGDLGETSSWHGDINLIYDTEGVNSDYRGHRNYTQYDYLRELYIDTTLASWDLRLGKQQVVWGTADGIKLLDIINPTDFREFNQNTFEDSRIPVWMINAESNIGERGNVQLIVSQAETNKLAGLWTVNDGESRATTTADSASPSGYSFIGNGQIAGQDRDQPFIFKGVDVITGGVNGFFNIGSAFGSVTNTFAGGTIPGSPNFINPFGGLNPGMPEFATVAGFTGTTFQPDCQTPGGPVSGAACLELFTEITNADVVNLVDVNKVDATTPGAIPLPNGTFIDPTGTGFDITNPNSAWEYFPNATFATFNAYVGLTTEYRRDYDDDFLPSDANLGGRFRGFLDNGLNYSINYFYGFDPNPSLNIHWEDSATNERLVVDNHLTTPAFTDGSGANVLQIQNAAGTVFYGAAATFNPGSYADPSDAPTDVDPVGTGNNGGPAKLVFVEDRNRIHNLGGSFDYALEAGDVPVVLRGEFLYQKDVNQPVIDRFALANGDLVGALKSDKHDFFKYVIGVDVTVMTNLLVSGQFIQFRNLDFVNQGRACATQIPGISVDCSRYTGDPATMSLTNGMNKGYENKEFYSLFFSKPFGEAQLGRWNNITIYEEGGGWWNRFDAEYSFSDQLIATGELNLYFGDEDTTFGQFKYSSNLQVGVKYIFE